MRQIVVVLAACLSVVSSATAQAPLTVGLDGTFAPHAMPKPGGGVEGFNVDMANEIGRRLGRPITIVAQEFSGLVPGMNAKRFDFLVAPVTVTAERSKTMLFTEGYAPPHRRVSSTIPCGPQRNVECPSPVNTPGPAPCRRM